MKYWLLALALLPLVVEGSDLTLRCVGKKNPSDSKSRTIRLSVTAGDNVLVGISNDSGIPSGLFLDVTRFIDGVLAANRTGDGDPMTADFIDDSMGPVRAELYLRKDKKGKWSGTFWVTSHKYFLSSCVPVK